MSDHVFKTSLFFFLSSVTELLSRKKKIKLCYLGDKNFCAVSSVKFLQLKCVGVCCVVVLCVVVPRPPPSPTPFLCLFNYEDLNLACIKFVTWTQQLLKQTKNLPWKTPGVK